MAEVTTVEELLRRMVLSTGTEYSDGIQEVLRAMGYEVAWAHVDGRTLTCYVGASKLKPKVGRELERRFGGTVRKVIGRDPYWSWQWQAPL